MENMTLFFVPFRKGNVPQLTRCDKVMSSLHMHFCTFWKKDYQLEHFLKEKSYYQFSHSRSSFLHVYSNLQYYQFFQFFFSVHVYSPYTYIRNYRELLCIEQYLFTFKLVAEDFITFHFLYIGCRRFGLLVCKSPLVLSLVFGLSSILNSKGLESTSPLVLGPW